MIYTATQNNIRVPVTKNGRGFCVAWKDGAAAQRRRKTFTALSDAKAFADATARRIADGNRRALNATDADLATLAAAQIALADLGTPLLTAIEEYKAARLRLGTMTLSEAVTIAIAKNAAAAPIPPTAQIVAELLATLRKRKRHGGHIRTIQTSLEPFARTFPNLRTVEPADIEDYLCRLRTSRAVNAKGKVRPTGSEVGTRTRDNVLAHLCTLFRAAKKHLPPPPYAPEEVPRLDKGPAIHTYTPEQIAQILDWFDAHSPTLIPYAALGAFAGLRTSEILRLDWSMVRWRTTPRLITIPASVAKKVNIPRKLEMNAALESWLRPWAHLTSGPVIPPGNHINPAIAKLRRALSWSHWHRNALRHSYASHRLAIRPDKAAVAIEMGTSPAMLDQHYNNPPNPEDATAYFAILREQPTNITAIKTA